MADENDKNEENERDLDDLLNEIIAEELESLKSLEPGSLEYNETANAAKEFLKIRIESNKLVNEYEDRQDRKKARRTDLIKDIFLGLTGVGIPILAYRVMFKEGLKFEQTGTYTASTLKDLIRKIRPTK